MRSRDWCRELGAQITTPPSIRGSTKICDLQENAALTTSMLEGIDPPMPRLKSTVDLGEWYVVRFAGEREFPGNSEIHSQFCTYRLDDVAETRLVDELGLKEDDKFPLSVFWELREHKHLYTRSEFDNRRTAFDTLRGIMPLLSRMLFVDAPPAPPHILHSVILDGLKERELIIRQSEVISFPEFKRRFGVPARTKAERDEVLSLYEDLKQLVGLIILY